VWTHPAVDLYSEKSKQIDWLGTLEISSIGSYIDVYLLIILGGIPWQVYFQRVLACRSPSSAQRLSFIAAFGCLLLAFPPAILGSLARAAGIFSQYNLLSILSKTHIELNLFLKDWANGTDYGKEITTAEEIKSILPMILQYLTPQVI